MGVHWTLASKPITMPAQRFIVTLTEDERTQLQALIHKGREHAFRRRRAQILRQVDVGPWGPGRTDTDTAEILSVGVSTVERARRGLYAPGSDRGPAAARAGSSPPRTPPGRHRGGGVDQAGLLAGAGGELGVDPATAGRSAGGAAGGGQHW